MWCGVVWLGPTNAGYQPVQVMNGESLHIFRYETHLFAKIALFALPFGPFF